MQILKMEHLIKNNTLARELLIMIVDKSKADKEYKIKLDNYLNQKIESKTIFLRDQLAGEVKDRFEKRFPEYLAFDNAWIGIDSKHCKMR